MKKYWIILVACILIFTAVCNQNADSKPTETVTETTVETTAETTLPPETTEETIPVPQTLCGTARVDGTPAVLSTKMRGDIVDIVGEYDESHYVVKTEQGYGLIRKELVRPEGEPEYEAWTAYACWNAEFYTNLYLSGEPVRKLSTNTKVEVLDDLGYCYVVKVDEVRGFIKPERVSKWQFSSGGSNDDGGSGGGGGGSSGQDGGDISLRGQVGIQLLAAIAQTGDVTGTGTILADGTEIVLGYFEQDEDIPVVQEEGFAESKEGFYTVYLEGLYAYVEENLVSLDAEDTFEAWDGYSRWSAVVYDNFHLIGSPKDKLNTNTKIHVVYELENCYMVQIEDTTGFMAKDMVSQYPYSSGGSSDDDGGSGGGASGGGGAEWSPPAL